MTDRLTLTAGLRWTYEDKTSSGYGRNVNGPNFITFGNTLVTPYTPNGGTVSQSGNFDDFTWRFAASYAVTDMLNTWVSYARGRRPDVISVDTNSPTFFSEAPAEIVDSVEAGAFWTFAQGTLSGSVFYSEYENFQTTRFDPNTVSFVTDNAGNATQYGMELQGRFDITERAELFASYAYNSATFDDTDSNGNALELAGNTFRYAPEHTFALGLNWLSPRAIGVRSTSCPPTAGSRRSISTTTMTGSAVSCTRTPTACSMRGCATRMPMSGSTSSCTAPI